MRNTTSLNIIISGAGPVGAVCAFLLARAGTSATLIERHKDSIRRIS